MAGVPYTFGTATANIPLLELDACFNTQITIGGSSVGLGNSITDLTGLGNLTMTGLLNNGGQTWAPTLFGAGAAGTPTYTLQRGNYLKVGNVVLVWGELAASLSGATGILTMGGFPATQNASNPTQGCLGLAAWGGPTLTGGYTTIGLQMVANTTTAIFYESGSGLATTPMGQSQLGAATLDIVFFGIYQSV